MLARFLVFIKQFNCGSRAKIALSLLIFWALALVTIHGFFWSFISLPYEKYCLLTFFLFLAGLVWVLFFTYLISEGHLPLIGSLQDKLSCAVAELDASHTNFENAWASYTSKKMLKEQDFTNAMQETALLHESFGTHFREVKEQMEKIISSLEEQNTKTKKTSSALAEMSLSIKSVSTHADLSVETSKASEEDAKKGGEVVSHIIRHMNKITQTVSKSATVIQELGKSAGTIVDIITVIEDIADQTNLLALNAAIEAARAGQQGRGFGVVADQIRSLAEKTTHATKEIAATLSSIQEKTARAVESMDEGIKEIDRGAGFAVQAGVSLRRIVSGAKKVTEMISNIASATEKQSQSAAFSSHLVTEIAQGVECTCHGSNSAILYLADLERQMQKLTQLMQNFLRLWTENILENEMIALGEGTTQEMILHRERLERVQSHLQGH